MSGTLRGPVLLVVARVPTPGLAKTRLAASVGDQAAAEFAATALLDTLTVVAEAAAESGSPSVVALTGDLGSSARRDEVEDALREHRVIGQRGDGLGDPLGERLANAHEDAAVITDTEAVVQVGMDTPQLSVVLLEAAVAALNGADAALGPATDGGWWCLAVRRAALARCLPDVAMSRPETGQATYAALRRTGARTVTWLPELRDVDTLPDALEVARAAPGSRFAAVVAASTSLTVEAGS